jgi:protein TonB
MNSEMIQTADVLDILFENRNKEYGAYVLRKGYNGRMLTAMYTVPALVLLFFLLNSLKNNNGNERRALLLPVIDEVELREMKMPEPEKPLPPAQPPRQVATLKSTPPVIVPDQVPADPPPPIEQLQQESAAIGTSNTEGEALQGDGPAPATANTGGPGTAPAEPPAETEQVLKVAEKMPEFPGGIEKLRRFLGRNLRVPEEAVEAGQRVRIPIRFVVGKDGTVTDVVFLDKADEVFKTEILRVMNKMPKWVPGYQNGRAVAVYFSIPILFEVAE